MDSVFCGELASTVVCQQCNEMSVVYEPFLDLSLPLRNKSWNESVSMINLMFKTALAIYLTYIVGFSVQEGW